MVAGLISKYNVEIKTCTTVSTLLFNICYYAGICKVLYITQFFFLLPIKTSR